MAEYPRSAMSDPVSTEEWHQILMGKVRGLRTAQSLWKKIRRSPLQALLRAVRQAGQPPHPRVGAQASRRRRGRDFRDVRRHPGSTGLAEQLPPREFGQLLTRFWGTAPRVVDRWDGTLAVRSRPRETFSWRLARARARRGSRWASASTPASPASATSGRATRSTSPP